MCPSRPNHVASFSLASKIHAPTRRPARTMTSAGAGNVRSSTVSIGRGVPADDAPRPAPPCRRRDTTYYDGSVEGDLYDGVPVDRRGWTGFWLWCWCQMVIHRVACGMSPRRGWRIAVCVGNSRQWGLLKSLAHIRRSREWCCRPLGAPRLLYFAAVQLWTAVGGGFPRAVCRDQAQNPGVVLAKGSTVSERVGSGGRWPVVSRGLYAATVTVIAWGTTFSSGTGSPESCRSSR